MDSGLKLQTAIFYGKYPN